MSFSSAAIADMSNSAGREYLGMVLGKTSTTCESIDKMVNKECFVVGIDHLSSRFDKQNAPAKLLEPAMPSVPGSLGPTDLTADFKVELNDMVRAERPVPGFDVGSDRVWHYYALTMTAGAQVRPTGVLSTNKTDPSAGATGRERARAHLILGPFERGSILPPVKK